MKRPQSNSPEVVEQAAKALLPKVIEWLNSSNGPYYSVLDADVLLDLGKALRYKGQDDGYHIAKALEQECWNVDSELVEILNHTGFHIQAALNAVTEDWIRTNNINPKHAVGDSVLVKTYPRIGVSPIEHTGVVVKINPQRGDYLIRISALGHVMPGKLGVQGQHVNWEDVD